MSDAELSSEFEYSASFLRILIPGVILTTLVSFLLNLNYLQYIYIFKESITESVWALIPIGVIFIVISMFVGLIINVFIIPLTQVLEGYTLELKQKNNYLNVFRNKLKRGQWKIFVENRKDYDSAEMGSIERGSAYTNIYYYFSHCLYELSKNPKIKDNELKKCILPTKLGNVFKSAEIYPEWKYGMNGVFFWTKIQLLMSEEDKGTIDRMRSFVDMFVELTWIFFFAGITYLIILAYEEKYIISIASLVIFILFSLVSYNMAVESALNFGLYVRSSYDIYREDLWNKIKSGQFNKLDPLPEKERWDNVFRYLWFYNVVQCQKCGKFYESTTEHVCNKF